MKLLHSFFIVLLILSACKTSQTSNNDINVTSHQGANIPPIEEEVPIWVSKTGEYNPEKTRQFKLENTKLEVSFSWEKQHLLGKATLSMQPYFYAQDKVILDAKGFDIHRVGRIQNQDTLKLPFKYDGLKLEISLDRSFKRDEMLHLFIDYTAKPNELKSVGSAAITDNRGLYFVNPLLKEPNKPRQIWTQGETEASSCWFPTFDAPNVKSKQEMYITIDTAYRSISNGKLIFQRNNNDGTRTDYWKQDKPHAPYLFAMAIGNFAEIKDKWRNIEVNYYVEPQYAPYAKNVFGNTPEMMEFFSKLLDYPYVWDKYSQVVVRDFVSGAMENTTVSIFMEQLNVDNRYLIDQNWDNIIAHELFHHWFGDLVTCESWANLPLNESFANYSEYLWLEYKYGVEEADLHWYEEFSQYMAEATKKQEPLIRYYYQDKEDMFDSHSYAKGGLILHLLRKTVGDEAFRDALRLYLKQNAFKKTEIHHLRIAFEEVTGEDLNWFFEQWFMKAGHPDIFYSENFENGILQLTVKQRQNPKYTPIYRIPLSVDIWVAGKKTRHKITLSKAEDVFTFNVAQKPDLVLFDAETLLPAKIDFVKSTEAFIFQFYNAEKLLAKIDALRELASDVGTNPTIYKVFIDALDHDNWAIREFACGTFAKYEGFNKNQVIDKLKELALLDKKSTVRATALAVLSTFGEYPAQMAVIKQAMQDSSYAVLATSLYAYINAGAGGENPTSTLQKFENINDFNVLSSLGDIYSHFGLPQKETWFEEKIRSIGGYPQQSMMNYYGTYLLKLPSTERKRGIEFLAKYASDGDSPKTRIAALQTLFLLEETDGVKERLQNIIQAEKNEEVLDYLKTVGEK
ncbi:MAG: hypothetical protein OHK0038_06350 [Flammeovirgaceae bacterium]